MTIAVMNGFKVKDNLKAHGFRFNATRKTWDIPVNCSEAVANFGEFLHRIGVNVSAILDVVESALDIEAQIMNDELKANGIPA